MATPTTPAELEAQLVGADPQKVAADPAGFGKLVRDYQAASMANYGESLKGQIAEQVQATVADVARDLKADIATIKPGKAIKHARGYNPNAIGAKLDEIYDGPVDFIKSTWHANHSPEAQAKVARVRNDYSSTYGPDGGFLVPESFRAQLLETALEDSIVRRFATVVPMETSRVLFPTIDVTSHASNVFGGLTGYWTEEGGALTESQATFGRVALDAKKLTGYSEVPNELFADSALSFEALLGRLWPRAIANFEDRAFFSGTGVGQPLGFLNADAAISVAEESSQAANTILWGNIINMYSRMLPQSLSRAVWIANINTLPQLAQMFVAGASAGSTVPLNDGTAAGAPNLTLLGRPVIFTEKCPTLGDPGDINFVDLSYYLIGDRQAMQMTNSAHYKFANDVTAVRIITRVDGRPWLQTALTPQVGSSTLSPFVKIENRD
jgi:HK97 family phage major capsid protein